MFTQVRLTNFKSFHGEHNVDLRRISVLVGPNGSGKSSVLQSLMLFAQSNSDQFNTRGSFLDLGQPEDVQIVGQPMPVLGLSVTRSIDLQHLTGVEGPSRIEANLNASFDRHPKIDFVVSYPPSMKFVSSTTEFESTVEPERIEIGNDFEQFAATTNITKPITRRHAIGATQNQSQHLLNVVSDALAEIRFVPALRGFAEARYPLRGQEIQNFAQNIDPRQNADALTSTIVFNDNLREDISDVLQLITGVAIDRDLLGDGSSAHAAVASVRPASGARPKRIVSTNEGFGTNQLIHLVGQTLVTPTGGAVLIEEPEAHLHPYGQFQLASFIARRSVDHDQQFLITTHSERFLAALLYQVREEILDPSDVIVHYFNLNEDGQSQHQRKGVTHGGIVEGSFRDFFPPSGIPGWEEFYRGLE